jgi:hypothetical protein
MVWLMKTGYSFSASYVVRSDRGPIEPLAGIQLAGSLVGLNQGGTEVVVGGKCRCGQVLSSPQT